MSTRATRNSVTAALLIRRHIERLKLRRAACAARHDKSKAEALAKYDADISANEAALKSLEAEK